jgi:hypothetical protein
MEATATMSPKHFELEADTLSEALLETEQLLQTHRAMRMGLWNSRSELQERRAELQETGWRIESACIEAIKKSHRALE